MNKLINFIAFQIIWLVAVLGAANELLWPTSVIVIAFAVWQLSPQRRHHNDMKFVLYALLFGLVLDSTWQFFGLIEYKLSLNNIVPIWILLLWMTLALTFNHSLAWLKNNPWFPIIFGCIGAPLSYFAGNRLEAISYPQGPLFISISLSISWAAVCYFFARYHTFQYKKNDISNERTR